MVSKYYVLAVEPELCSDGLHLRRGVGHGQGDASVGFARRVVAHPAKPVVRQAGVPLSARRNFMAGFVGDLGAELARCGG